MKIFVVPHSLKQITYGRIKRIQYNSFVHELAQSLGEEDKQREEKLEYFRSGF